MKISEEAYFQERLDDQINESIQKAENSRRLISG